MIAKIVKKYRKKGLGGLAQAVWRRVNGTYEKNPVHEVLNELSRRQEFTIVQIGAHVGNTDTDPLFTQLSQQLNRCNGKLICVEPVKEFYEQLKQNYGRTKNVFCENVAIAETSGESAFYRLGVDPVKHGYPEWLSQLGSLKSDRMGSLWDRYEKNEDYKNFYLKHRVKETVTCITFAELLRRHNITEVDLLQIDVEGYELEILSTIDFKKVPIHFINYECILLHESKKTCEELIARAGYEHFDYELDTFCFKKSAPEHLLKRWRQRVAPPRKG